MLPLILSPSFFGARMLSGFLFRFVKNTFLDTTVQGWYVAVSVTVPPVTYLPVICTLTSHFVKYLITCCSCHLRTGNFLGVYFLGIICPLDKLGMFKCHSMSEHCCCLCLCTHVWWLLPAEESAMS